MTLPIAYIRTSDRSTFRRCRRLWGWTSHLRQNLRIRGYSATPLWLGTGVHFALEDYHGYNVYGSPAAALRVYAEACRKAPNYAIPDDWKEALELGVAMMEHYIIWLETRDPLPTFIFNGHPQVEVRAEVPIELPEKFKEFYSALIYRVTLDRVAIDEYERLWIVEYKTAAQVRTDHLPTDGQVTAYSWLASVMYGQEIAGVIYQQHRKDIPNEARILASGKISTAKQQKTTASNYKKALVNVYGMIETSPEENIACYNELLQRETEDRDDFIQRDRVERNAHQIQAEGVKVLLELEDILNPDLPLYPNPTRECSYCNFESACVSLDDGSDWINEMEMTTEPREDDRETWRQYLSTPQHQNPLQLMLPNPLQLSP